MFDIESADCFFFIFEGLRFPVVVFLSPLLRFLRSFKFSLIRDIKAGKASAHKGLQRRVPVAVPLAPSVDRVLVCKGSDKKIGYQESNFHNGKDDSHQ